MFRAVRLNETSKRDMKILNVMLCVRVSLSRYFESHSAFRSRIKQLKKRTQTERFLFKLVWVYLKKKAIRSFETSENLTKCT